MARILKLSSLLAFIVLAVVLILLGIWIFEPLDVAEAVGEYLIPTTVEIIPLACTQTNQEPPADLMQLVNTQENFYHLTLQKVTVCLSSVKGPSQKGFSGLPRDEEFRMRWKPLPERCCTSQFRRHVLVVVGDFNEGGSVIVEAALIQSRRDYLNDKWDKFTLKLRRFRNSFSAWRSIP